MQSVLISFSMPVYPGAPKVHSQVVENLLLDGDVEGAGGLVGDDQLRSGGQRYRDEHALVKAAGQVVGYRRLVARVALARERRLRLDPDRRALRGAAALVLRPASSSGSCAVGR